MVRSKDNYSISVTLESHIIHKLVDTIPTIFINKKKLFQDKYATQAFNKKEPKDDKFIAITKEDALKNYNINAFGTAKKILSESICSKCKKSPQKLSVFYGCEITHKLCDKCRKNIVEEKLKNNCLEVDDYGAVTMTCFTCMNTLGKIMSDFSTSKA